MSLYSHQHTDTDLSLATYSFSLADTDTHTQCSHRISYYTLEQHEIMALSFHFFGHCGLHRGLFSHYDDDNVRLCSSSGPSFSEEPPSLHSISAVELECLCGTWKRTVLPASCIFLEFSLFWGQKSAGLLAALWISWAQSQMAPCWTLGGV